MSCPAHEYANSAYHEIFGRNFPVMAVIVVAGCGLRTKLEIEGPLKVRPDAYLLAAAPLSMTHSC